MSSQAKTERDEVRTFWTGPPLSQYEILSLKSFVATGANVILYSYDDIDVPAGVDVRDAREILPGELHEFRTSSGDISWSRHSDIFRYEMLRRHGGWYADLDIVCLKSELPKNAFYIGNARNQWLNGAVLHFPVGDKVLEELFNQANRILPTLDGNTSESARIAIGPALINRVTDQFKARHLTQPENKVYEIAFSELLAFFDPAQCEAVCLRLESSDFTHLWNEGWRALRIPKDHGPPKGSFLDLLFKRFDVAVSEQGRLQYEAVATWSAEEQLLTRLKHKLGVEKIDQGSFSDLQFSIRPHRAQPYDLQRTSVPQTVRSFWHGDTIGPYALACMRSFADHGHTVELFTYNPDLNAPSWIKIRDASEIISADDVLKLDPVSGQIAVHADLFRYALLKKLGGWWIDPDLVLLAPNLPAGDVVVLGRDVFGRVPTALLRFPAHHPIMDEALSQARNARDLHQNPTAFGSELLTAVIADHHLGPPMEIPAGPISWLNVPDLFNPGKAEDLLNESSASSFVHLQAEVWQRAGVPQDLAPPIDSFIDKLLSRHPTGAGFVARMEFGQLNRWIRHMYRSIQVV